MRRAIYEDELAVPDFPLPLRYLWQIYCRIRRRKGGNGFGPLPIEWIDIAAFCRMNGIALDPWEVGVLEMLDDLFLAAKPDGETTLVDDDQ